MLALAGLLVELQIMSKEKIILRKMPPLLVEYIEEVLPEGALHSYPLGQLVPLYEAHIRETLVPPIVNRLVSEKKATGNTRVCVVGEWGYREMFTYRSRKKIRESEGNWVTLEEAVSSRMLMYHILSHLPLDTLHFKLCDLVEAQHTIPLIRNATLKILDFHTFYRRCEREYGGKIPF